ncbi:MAG: hypothetical protein ACKOXO_11655 [Cyanobium sp.]
MSATSPSATACSATTTRIARCRAALLAAATLLFPATAQAQQAGYGQTLGTTPMERQLYEGGTGKPSGGSLLDSTNPIDLMNRIRRGTAMDAATPPASAIDQALRDLEAQAAPAPALNGTLPRSASPQTTVTSAGQPAAPASTLLTPGSGLLR